MNEHSTEEFLNKWQSQLRKGALEICILGLIAREPTYAFAMIQSLQKHNSFNITEGALYPLLKRLQKEGQVENFWVESDSGPPRKYYKITAYGEKLLEAMRKEWLSFADFVNVMVALKTEISEIPDALMVETQESRMRGSRAK